MSIFIKHLTIIVVLSALTLAGWCDDRFLENYLPAGEENIVRHDFYTSVYNPETRTGKWVMFTLSTLNTLKFFKRDKLDFERDPLIQGSPSTTNYNSSGYDRGHMCSANIMKFCEVALKQTFYTSNIAPQNPHFNRGIWKSLEEKVGNLIDKGSVMVVVVGVIHDKDKGYEYIGQEKVAVPNFYYMIIYDLKKDRLSVFLMSNKNDLNGELTDYMVTLEAINNRTGVGFFKNAVEKSRYDKIENIFE